jgi:hypothetical protein
MATAPSRPKLIPTLTALVRGKDGWPELPPALLDIPEYRAAHDRLAEFNARTERAQQELARENLEAEFEARPIDGTRPGDPPRRTVVRGMAVVHSRAEDSLWQRLQELRALDPYPYGVPVTAGGDDALARAEGLLRGEAEAKVLTRTERRAKLHADIEAMRAAAAAQHDVVEQIRDRLSYELSLRLAPVHRDQLLAYFEACRKLAAMTLEMQQFYVGCNAAGYRMRSDIVPAPTINAPLYLGTETEWNSQISTFRRQLIEIGVLS